MKPYKWGTQKGYGATQVSNGLPIWIGSYSVTYLPTLKIIGNKDMILKAYVHGVVLE